jgi:cytochrome P450
MQITSTGSSDDSSNSSSLCPFHQKNWESRTITIGLAGGHHEVSSPGYFQSTTKNIRSFWNYVVNSFDVVKGYLTGQFNPMPFMIRPGVFKEVCPYNSIADRSVTVTDPSIIKAILQHPRRGALFENGLASDIITSIAGKNNLMTTFKEQHDCIRGVITPFFKYDTVKKNYASHIEKQAIAYANAWSKTPITNITSETHRFALEVISKHILKFENPTEEIQKAIGILGKFGVKYAIFPSLLLKYLSNLFWNEAEQRQKAETTINEAVNRVCSTQQDCLLGAMHQSSLTPEQIFDTVKLLFVAGQEPTASLLTTVIYYLGLNPELRTKIYEELQKSPKKSLIERIEASPMLRYVVSECLRLHTPAPVISRNARDNLEIRCEETQESFFIPKGTTVNCDILYSNKDERRCEDPDDFKPSRFENTFIHVAPFGSGPERCIGKFLALLEVKILVAVLIERFEWKNETTHIKETYNLAGGIAADHQQNFFIFLIQYLLGQAPSNDIFIKFSSRV